MKNVILDLKEMVNKHSQTINKLARVVNAQQERIKELEDKGRNNSPFGVNLGDL